MESSSEYTEYVVVDSPQWVILQHGGWKKDQQFCSVKELICFEMRILFSWPWFQASAAMFMRSWPVKMGPTRCSETSVNSYHTTPRNIPEEWRSCSRGLWNYVSGWSDTEASRGKKCLIFKGRYVLEDEGTIFPRNVGVRLPNNAASYPRRMKSSAIPLRGPQNSRVTKCDTGFRFWQW
jgi:hypothetical protein